MDIQHVSEQRLVLKIEDKVQQVGIQNERDCRIPDKQEAQYSRTCLPGVPLQMTLAVVLRNEHAGLL